MGMDSPQSARRKFPGDIKRFVVSVVYLGPGATDQDWF